MSCTQKLPGLKFLTVPYALWFASEDQGELVDIILYIAGSEPDSPSLFNIHLGLVLVLHLPFSRSSGKKTGQDRCWGTSSGWTSSIGTSTEAATLWLVQTRSLSQGTAQYDPDAPLELHTRDKMTGEILASVPLPAPVGAKDKTWYQSLLLKNEAEKWLILVQR